TCLIHFDTVPSAMDSPIWGIGTSIRAMMAPKSCGSVACQVPTGGDDVAHLRQKVVLERRRVGHRRVNGCDAQDGSVQPLEGLLVDAHRNLARDATGTRVLVDDEYPAGLADRLENRLLIER